jgi:multidrug resistance protein
MSKLLKLPRFFLLLMLVSFPTLMAMLISPALPDMTIAFQLTPGESQWLISIYLIGFSIGHLIYGPMANRIGRKKTVLWGIFIALIGSVLAMMSTVYSSICLGRFIQALGAAAGLKITFTMVADLHTGKKATQTLSYLLFGFAVAPSLGITLGGFLTSAFGWRGCFVFMAIYSAALFLLCHLLHETAQLLTKGPIHPKGIFHTYARQFKDSFLTLHSLLIGFVASIVYVFISEAPYIAIHSMSMTPYQYGLYNLLLPIGMVAGLFMGNRMAGQTSSRIAMLSGILLMIVGTFAMAFLFASHIYNGWSFFLPQLVIQMGGFVLFLYASSKGLSEAKDKSNASAVLQCITYSSATLVTFGVGTFAPKAPFTLPLTYGIILLATVAVWMALHEHHKRTAHKE